MFRIDADFSEIQELLNRLDDRLSNLTPFWNDFAIGLVSDRVDDVFETEGHGRWPALNPEYAREKAIDFPGRGILERTGAYRAAASNPTAAGHIQKQVPRKWYSA